jgi:hypothetical protein
MASNEAEEIVKRLMPEVEIVRRPRADATEQPEDRPPGGPSLAAVKGKYARPTGTSRRPARRSAAPEIADVDEDDIEVVQVMPPGSSSDASGPQARSVIVSKKLGKIIGKQG